MFHVITQWLYTVFSKLLHKTETFLKLIVLQSNFTQMFSLCKCILPEKLRSIEQALLEF